MPSKVNSQVSLMVSVGDFLGVVFLVRPGDGFVALVSVVEVSLSFPLINLPLNRCWIYPSL